mgnify:CR=1 FL=1
MTTSDYWIAMIREVQENSAQFKRDTTVTSVTGEPLWSSSLPSAEHEHNEQRENLKSDYLLVYPAVSSLGEAVGHGLFARSDTPAGTILCEYRGVFDSRKWNRCDTVDCIQYAYA